MYSGNRFQGLTALSTAKARATYLGDPYVASQWPGMIVTDQNGQPVDPKYLQVVVDQMGNRVIVPLPINGAPSVITTYQPDVITWVDEPGTGGIVQRKLVNGIETAEVRSLWPESTITRAQALAFNVAMNPDYAAEFQDFANPNGPTQIGLDALAILQSRGAAFAASMAQGVIAHTIDVPPDDWQPTGVYAGNDHSLDQPPVTVIPPPVTTGPIDVTDDTPVTIATPDGGTQTVIPTTGQVLAVNPPPASDVPAGGTDTSGSVISAGGFIGAAMHTPMFWVGVAGLGYLYYRHEHRRRA